MHSQTIFCLLFAN